MARPVVRIWMVVVLLVALAMAGCGGSGDDASTPATGPRYTVPTITTETTVRALQAEEIDVTASPYCATWAQIRSAGGPRTQGLEPAAKAARYKEYYGQLLPLVTQLTEQAPEEIREAAEAARARTEAAATDGSFAPFQERSAKDGAAALAQYALDNCAKK